MVVVVWGGVDLPMLVGGALPEDGCSRRVGEGSRGGLPLSVMLATVWEWRRPCLPPSLLSDRLEL